jgi:hypothetical protein
MSTCADWAAAPRVLLQTEDRPVVKERTELIQEHRPVEKEFVVSAGVGLCWLRVTDGAVLAMCC